MNHKMIVALIIGALVLLVCGMFIGGFWMMHYFSSVPTAFSGTQPAYGPGMMGGRGPMMRGPGAFGTPFAQNGYSPPRSGSGGLVAVTADAKPIPSASDAPKLPENTAAQKVGNMNVTLALSPYPPSSFQNGSFDITLIDDKGQPVTDAKVSLDLTMPGMWMPPSKPDAQNIDNGKYHAGAFWTMRGLWKIEVIITRGNAKQSAFFAVWL